MHAYSVRPDVRCQRGLHFVYVVPAATDLERLEQALAEAFGERLIRSEEPWGKRRVRRLVLQFRFEVRLGVRDDEISFLFRSTSPALSRAADQACFEAVLAAVLEVPS